MPKLFDPRKPFNPVRLGSPEKSIQIGHKNNIAKIKFIMLLRAAGKIRLIRYFPSNFPGYLEDTIRSVSKTIRNTFNNADTYQVLSISFIGTT